MRQASFTLVQHQEIPEQIHFVEHDVGIMGQNFTPIFAAGIGYGCAHQAEVASGIVDAHVERAAIVVGIIFDALLAGLDNLPIAVRLSGRNKAGFASRMAARDQEDIRLAASLVGFDVEALVGFLVDEDVRVGRSHSMSIEPVLAFGNVIFLRVEDRLIVIGPNN